MGPGGMGSLTPPCSSAPPNDPAGHLPSDRYVTRHGEHARLLHWLHQEGETVFRATMILLSVLSVTGCETSEVRDDLGSDGNGESTLFNGNVGAPAWAWPTNPEEFAQVLEESISTELSRLPLSGDALRPSWSAARWTGLADSTNNRWMADELSPVEKYDAAFNGWEETKTFQNLVPFDPVRCDLVTHDAQYYKDLGPAAEWMTRHRGNWAAHDGLDSDSDQAIDECDDLDGVNHQRDLDHAWAAAAMVEHEPVKPVTVGQVTFWPSDIKALLLTIYDNASAFILTGSCQAQVVERTPDGILAMKGCAGMSASDFHIMLTNFIGRFEASLGDERSENGQLISRPIDSYFIDLQRDLTAADALSLLGLEASPDDTYSPNPDARGWAEIHLTLHARERSTVGQVGEDGAPGQEVVSTPYHYILELDGQGRVIGGQWLADEGMTTPPDYLWIAQGPRFERALGKLSPETPAAGNPYVKYSEVRGLLQDSQSDQASGALEVQRTSEDGPDPLPN